MAAGTGGATGIVGSDIGLKFQGHRSPSLVHGVHG